MPKNIPLKHIDEYRLLTLFRKDHLMKGFKWINKKTNYGEMDLYQLTKKDKIIYVINPLDPVEKELSLDIISKYDYCHFYNLIDKDYLKVKEITMSDRWFRIRERVELDKGGI
ncbi:MAG: hypothetical protein ACOC2W_04865 [bacterium]